MRLLIGFLSLWTLAQAEGEQSSYKAGTQLAELYFPGYPDSLPDPKAVAGKYPQDKDALKAQARGEGSDVVTSLITTPSDYKYTIADSDPLLAGSQEIVENPEQAVGVQEVTQTADSKITRHQCYEFQEAVEEKCSARLVPQLVGKKKQLKTQKIEVSYNSFNGLGANLLFKFLETGSCKCLWSLNRAAITDGSSLASLTRSLRLSDHGIAEDQVRALKIVGHNGHCEDQMYGLFGNKQPSWFVKPSRYTLEVTHEVEVLAYELQWQNDCQALEERVDHGECDLIARQCLDSVQTKFLHDQEFTADCWFDERRYRCHHHRQDECEALKKKGCFQISSHCVERQDTTCTRWLQTYQCGEEKQTRVRFQGSQFYCLDGDCHSASWTANQDMADSLAKLAVLKEMKTDMSPDKTKVFQGKALSCSRNPVGFKDCCKFKGWGKKIGLAGCDENEKELAVQRQDNKCVYVGSYCRKKKLGQCVDRRNSFCCFGSKLSRIFNEQGRRLLGLSWGDARQPHCDGLTISQFTKIDLGKIDFSEIFNDLMEKIKTPNTQAYSESLNEQDINLKLKDQEKNINGA